MPGYGIGRKARSHFQFPGIGVQLVGIVGSLFQHGQQAFGIVGPHARPLQQRLRRIGHVPGQCLELLFSVRPQQLQRPGHGCPESLVRLEQRGKTGKESVACGLPRGAVGMLGGIGQLQFQRGVDGGNAIFGDTGLPQLFFQRRGRRRGVDFGQFGRQGVDMAMGFLYLFRGKRRQTGFRQRGVDFGQILREVFPHGCGKRGRRKRRRIGDRRGRSRSCRGRCCLLSRGRRRFGRRGGRFPVGVRSARSRGGRCGGCGGRHTCGGCDCRAHAGSRCVRRLPGRGDGIGGWRGRRYGFQRVRRKVQTHGGNIGSGLVGAGHEGMPVEQGGILPREEPERIHAGCVFLPDVVFTAQDFKTQTRAGEAETPFGSVVKKARKKDFFVAAQPVGQALLRLRLVEETPVRIIGQAGPAGFEPAGVVGSHVFHAAGPCAERQGTGGRAVRQRGV